MPPPESGRPWTRRRVLLTGLLVGAVPAVAGAGCGVDLGAVRRDDVPPPQPPEPGPDDLARDLAVRGATTLGDAAAAAVAARPDLAELLAHVAADHAAHLVQLGPADPPETATPDPGSSATSPPGVTSPSPDVPPPDVSGLGVDEAAGATELLAVVEGISGPLARLLTAVAASRAGHAVELSAALGVAAPVPPLTPFGATGTLDSPDGPGPVEAGGSGAAEGNGAAEDDGAGSALLALVDAEHAAAYTYGVLAVRLADEPRTVAIDAIDHHRRAAARLTDVAVALGLDPPPAAPAYLTPPVADAAAATALAADVELGLASAAAVLVAGAEASLRQLAADVVVARALASRAWRSPLPALPGLPEHAS